MRKSPIFLFVYLLWLSGIVFSQVSPPKHESGNAHVRRSRALNYDQRFDAIKCAIVIVLRGEPVAGSPMTYGSGFYASEDGDIITASHVIGDRVWTKRDNGVTVDLPVPELLTIISDSGRFTVPRSSIEEDRVAWGADVARIKTGKKVGGCWLATGDDTKVRTGESVITVGFPGLAFGSLSLYTGIISATKMVSQLPVGRTVNTNEPVAATNTFIRVQMPISGGLSGAPIIDDNNKVIAVVSAAGLWSEALDRLIFLWDTNQLGPPVLQPPQSLQPDSLNLGWAVGTMAKSFHQFSSPGYGDSVPLSYLKKKEPQPNPPSSPHVH